MQPRTTYNGNGLKVKRVGPDGTTLYYHDGFRPIWETDALKNLTNELDRDIFGNLLGRREMSGARRYVHSDGLGSTTALTNEAGAITATVLYDAWGQTRAYTNPELLGKYLFTGAGSRPEAWSHKPIKANATGQSDPRRRPISVLASLRNDGGIGRLLVHTKHIK